MRVLAALLTRVGIVIVCTGAPVGIKAGKAHHVTT